jgi:four helix bundle protein
MVDFKELKVWQKAHQMTLTTYRVTSAFPREEMYGLISQLRCATSSVGANIARAVDAVQTVTCAVFYRSRVVRPARPNTIFLLARDLHFLDEKDFKALTSQADELQRMLTGLIQSVRPPKSVQVPWKLAARSSQLEAFTQ